MKTAYRATLASILAAAALLASSCNNAYGVFYSIQRETKQSGSEYFKKASVTGAYKLGSGSSAVYYASGAKLYSRGAGASDWGIVPIGGAYDYRLLAAAGDGAELYASIQVSGENRLYYRTAAADWAALSIAAIPSGSWIDALYLANGTLFAQAHDNHENEDNELDDSYSLYYSSGGSALAAAAASSLADLPYNAPFVGVAYDGSAYWYATKLNVYQGGAAATAAATALASGVGPAGKTVTGLAFLDQLYVGTYDFDDNDNPYLYYFNGAWGSKEVGSGGPLYAFGYIASPAKMLVGEAIVGSSTGGGYYEGAAYSSLVTGDRDDSSYVTLSESNYSTTIGDRPVNAFFWDDENKTLFVCMAAGASSGSYFGLYHSRYNGNSWDGWEAE